MSLRLQHRQQSIGNQSTRALCSFRHLVGFLRDTEQSLRNRRQQRSSYGSYRCPVAPHTFAPSGTSTGAPLASATPFCGAACPGAGAADAELFDNELSQRSLHTDAPAPPTAAPIIPKAMAHGMVAPP